LNTKYDILVPIFNAYEPLACCLKSLERYTTTKHRILLLDDASQDPRVRPLLEAFSRSRPNAEAVFLERNVGYVKTVNKGLSISQYDVILLNSDTQLTPRWLEKLDRCRWSDRAIGVVSPLSNYATLLSVPVPYQYNFIPHSWSPEKFSKLIEGCAKRAYPRIPTAVGFCMLLTRKTIDHLGPFNMAFGRGYGEEVDYCLSAWQAGFEVACCDDTYVYHVGEASFGRSHPSKFRNEVIVNLFWPNYIEVNREMEHSGELEKVRKRIRNALKMRVPPERLSGHDKSVRKSFSVPIGLRALAFSLSKNRPLKRLSKECYTQAAKLVAKQVHDNSQVKAVFLRGGALKEPVPGVSDLDFTAILRNSMSSSETLSLINKWHRLYILKRALVPLGEVVLFDSDTVGFAKKTSPPLILQYLHHQWLSGDPIQFTPFQGTIVSKLGGLLLSLDLYRQSMEALIKSATSPYRSYYMSHFRRRLRKLLTVCSRNDLALDGQEGDDTLLAMAFQELSTLGEKLWCPSQVSDSSQMTILTGPTNVGVGHWSSLRWLSLLRNAGIPVDATSVPLQYILVEPYPNGQLLSTFQTLIAVISSEKNKIKSMLNLCKLATPFIVPIEIGRLKIGSFDYLNYLEKAEHFIRNPLTRFSEDEGRVKMFFETLKVITATHTITLPGEFIFSHPQALGRATYNYLYGAASLACRSFDNFDNITAVAKAVLPKTTRLLKQYFQAGPRSVDLSHLPDILDSRSEIMDKVDMGN